MIRDRLIDGSKDFHSKRDPQSVTLEHELIKPVVNYLIELQSADENISAATILYNQKLYEASINRSYYSMMNALKALLENKELLKTGIYLIDSLFLRFFQTPFINAILL